MLSSNGGVWSSKDFSKNNKIKGFKFGRGDTVIVEINPFKKNVWFGKEGTEESYMLEVTGGDFEFLHPVILFYYSDNVVKFVNNYK
jgi:hypothetical protein